MPDDMHRHPARILILVLLACMACSTCKRSKASPTMKIQLLPEASAATRLLLGDDEHFITAELAGDWTREEFPVQAHVPPVLKIIDMGSQRVVTTVNGWALGAPLDSGDQWYVAEHDEEYRYSLRHTGDASKRHDLEPPPGHWAMAAALRTGDQGIVILSSPLAPTRDRDLRRQKLWIASFALDSLTLSAERVLEVSLGDPANGRIADLPAGVAANPQRSQVYLVALPDPRPRPGDAADGGTGTTSQEDVLPWRLYSLDSRTLQEQWHTEFVPSPTHRGNAARSLALCLVTPTGDGARVVVVCGTSETSSLSPESMFSLDPGDGRIVESFDESFMKPATAFDWTAVYQVVAVPGSGRIALLRVLDLRDRWDRLDQITVFAPDQRKVVSTWQRSRGHLGDDFDRLKELYTNAIAVTSSGTLLIAPKTYHWSREYGLEGDWPTGFEQGARRAEVRGLVTTPTDWHHRDRPRVRARLEALGERVF